MRIATWNLGQAPPNGWKRARELRKHMQAIEADVWVLTEAHPEFVPPGDFKTASAQTAGALPKGHCWVMIWVREGFECRAIEHVTLSDRTAAVRITRPDRPALIVVGTVLPWRTDTSGGSLRGTALFLAELSAQAETWHELRRAYPTDEFCIAGDFNQELTGPIGAGSKQGREELAKMLRDRDLRPLTALEPPARTGVGANIDHIVASGGLVLSKLEFWPATSAELQGLTDHYGVCVELYDA